MTGDRYLPIDEVLPLLDAADAALHATVAGFGEADLTHDSLCQGWTRAHVLTHLARNADGLANLVQWATTGVPTPAYASAEQRDADIEAGVARESALIKTDLARSGDALRPRLEELVGRDDLVPVRSRTDSPELPGDQIPWARLREVTMHHVDLDAGFSFSDADPAVVQALLDEAADRVGAHPDSPAVTLIAADTQQSWQLGSPDADDRLEVRGLPGPLLLWLARGIERDLHHDGDLPTLPAWG